MATAEQIVSLRLLIAEPNDVAPFSDAELGERIDAADSDLDLVAYEVWTEKAASYAGAVDTTESGSSRKLSQLQDNALEMAASFQTRATPTGATRLHRLTR